MKPEIVNGVKTIGPWGWSRTLKRWYLWGNLSGMIGYLWHDTCLTLTCHAAIDARRETVPVRRRRRQYQNYVQRTVRRCYRVPAGYESYGG